MIKATKEKKKTADEASLQIVTFLAGDEEYGLDIKSITEVIRPLKVTPLPRMPQFVEGVINLRGVIIPIVDLRKRFSLSTINNNRRTMRMIITRGALPGTPGVGTELLGLVVDAVNDVFTLLQKDIEPTPPAAVGQNAEFIIGMGKTGGKLTILLDIAKILSRQERSALVEAGMGDDENTGR